MKEYIFSFVILFLLGCLFIAGIDSLRQFSEIDFCLDRGACWDSIRQRCETEHQGYCVKNARTKIRDKERERIFESGVLDSGATGRLARSKTSRLRRTALFAQDCSSLFKGVWDDEKMFCEIPSL